METLFNIDEVQTMPPNKFCRTCEHLERWACGGSYFHYCGVRKSNRTSNGQLKVLCKTPACLSYKEINEKLNQIKTP